MNQFHMKYSFVFAFQPIKCKLIHFSCFFATSNILLYNPLMLLCRKLFPMNLEIALRKV